jgi:hypothetical protein
VGQNGLKCLLKTQDKVLTEAVDDQQVIKFHIPIPISFQRKQKLRINLLEKTLYEPMQSNFPSPLFDSPQSSTADSYVNIFSYIQLRKSHSIYETRVDTLQF